MKESSGASKEMKRWRKKGTLLFKLGFLISAIHFDPMVEIEVSHPLI